MKWNLFLTCVSHKKDDLLILPRNGLAIVLNLTFFATNNELNYKLIFFTCWFTCFYCFRRGLTAPSYGLCALITIKFSPIFWSNDKLFVTLLQKCLCLILETCLNFKSVHYRIGIDQSLFSCELPFCLGTRSLFYSALNSLVYLSAVFLHFRPV